MVGLLSYLDRKNAETIAAFVDVERLVLQEFIGTVPWDHRPLLTVLVRQVVEQLGAPDGVIAFDPSSFPKRGTHSVGVKRQWCSHRGKIDNCQVGVFMGYVARHDHCGPQIFYLHALKWFPRVHSPGRMSYTALDISPLSCDNKSEELWGKPRQHLVYLSEHLSRPC